MAQSTSQQPCRNCGNVNPTNDNFCAKCGTPLKETVTGTLASSHAPGAIAGRRITGALASGTLIGSRYNVIRLLGRGGFGAVYLAVDNRFPDRRVAVKEMGDARLSPTDRAQAITRFRQEANLLSRLQHPNLPAVHDFLEEGGKAYMVMDFIDGQTLAQVQKVAGGPLDEAQVMSWALQICEVLDYLHHQPQPIIFRDLKPPNTMVMSSGQIKLIDFGIARIFRVDAVMDTNWLGSQGYAAPEQYGLGQGQTDRRTDIYALGAMLYTLLTNREPLASFARMANLRDLDPPRKLNPHLSPGVEQLILTAMQVEKQQRYQSAIEMARAIDRLGFSVIRSTGGMGALSGPDAPTFPETRPGSHLPSSTLQPAATAPGAPLPGPPQPAGVQFAPVVPHTDSTMSTQEGSTTFQLPAAQTGSTLAGPPGEPPLPPGQGYPGVSGRGGTPTVPTQMATGAVPPLGENTRGTISRRTLLIGGSVAALAAATGIYFLTHSSAASGTVTVSLAYSTEKAAWLQEAASAFNAANQKLNGSGKTIQLQLSDLGSVDSVDQILSSQPRPTAWSPASTLEVNRLDYKWQQEHKGTPIISYTEQFQPRSLVRSPLVLASWQQRAQLLLQHYRVSTLDWDILASAFQVNNWSQIGGHPDWGAVKFGQTLPTQSNSGLLTITLLAYHYYKETRGLTGAQVNAASCWDYLGQFEGAVNAFGHSSGTYLIKDAIGTGPAQADVIATYENLVLTTQAQAQSQQHQPLLIYYPAVNLLSDHPFVVLQGDWSSDEQKQAALQFRDFLLDADQQRQALANGFRPTNSSISLNDSQVANNPFTRQLALFPGRRPDSLLSLAQAPAGDTVDALLQGWQQHYPAPPSTDG
jgi:serine/threonine protein kinase